LKVERNKSKNIVLNEINLKGIVLS